MPDQPKVAANMDEFNAQARSFVAKAKQKGLSNTDMAGMITFMYGQFLEQEKNKITPYQQALLDRQDAQDKKDEWKLVDTNGDGTMEWVNMSTRAIEQAGTGSKAAQFDDNQQGDLGANPASGENSQFNVQPGASPEALQAAIDASGQGDQYGVVGMSDPTILEKSPEYMNMSEEEKQKLFAEQAAAEAAKKTQEEQGFYATQIQPNLPQITGFINNPIGTVGANAITGAAGALAPVAKSGLDSFKKFMFGSQPGSQS